ncbi:MAG: hypothetical protein KIS77_22335 [Saprospiraceae bacterium]|nr:hypothetical protein [Saprospiraceae bacterium]
MFYLGHNLLDTAAALQPATLESVFHRLRDDAALRDDTERLRRVKQLDASAYTRLKVRLPFFCCGQFDGGLRRTEHFEQIQAWVLDVDKLSGDATTLAEWKTQLSADERVALLFRSPGGDGLKLVFRLDEPCTDTKTFTDAYKAFAFAFGEQYGLSKYIDFRTSDVTRVCFMAHDPLAYVNPLADHIGWRGLLPEQTQPAMAELLAEKTGAAAQPAAEKPGRSHAIHPDTYADILRKLQTRARPNPLKRDVFVPEAIGLALPVVQAALEAQGIQVAEVRDIQFGKQLALKCGNDAAEINLYYGKRGFSVVQVPKRNTNESLCGLAVFVTEQAIFSRHEWYGRAPQEAADTMPSGGAADQADILF